MKVCPRVKGVMKTIRMMHHKIPTPVRLTVLLIAVCGSPQVVHGNSPIIVGTGTPASCTELALQNALTVAAVEGPDLVQFNCGSSPVTIAITVSTALPDGSTGGLLPPDQTTIDGGNRITLACFNWSGALVRVDAGRTVTLANLTLDSRWASDWRQFPLPTHVENRGSLFLRNVTVFGDAPGSKIVNAGTLTMQNSTVTGTAAWGLDIGDLFYSGTLSYSALSNGGSATIDHSTFSSNAAVGIGGAISNWGTLKIDNSVFTGNSTFADHCMTVAGGAIANAGTIMINNSEFSGNGSSGPACGARGGAIASWSDVPMKVTNSSFSGNFTWDLGGAIDAKNAVIQHCKFSGNRAPVGLGGAISVDTLYMENSIVAENDAWRGGGIFWWGSSGALTIVNSRITSNSAESGGGIYTYASSGTLNLVRTEVANNTPDDIYIVPSTIINTFVER